MASGSVGPDSRKSLLSEGTVPMHVDARVRIHTTRFHFLAGIAIAHVAQTAVFATGGEPRKALDVKAGMATVAAKPAYGSVPLTFECFAKLNGRDFYNIIVAHESKASATHWELFSLPKTGVLSAYLPGRKPDTFYTPTDIADGKWHYLAMVLEKDRIRLYVDGVEKLNAPLSGPPDKGISGPLCLGALTTGELRCNGLIDEVRLSNTAREVRGVPSQPFAADSVTIGLWHFDQLDGGKYADASQLGNAARYSSSPVDSGPGHIPVAGGMSADYLPLPAPEDANPLRAALVQVVRRLELRTVSVDQIRDSVLREWSHDLTWDGKMEHPNRGIWYQDKEAVRQQVFDRHSLVWDSDGGPLGTGFRRIEVLIRNAESRGQSPDLGDLVHDLQLVRAACEADKPRPGTDLYKACYLALCAIRREVALRNPLLDFDTILFVARGTFAGSARSNPSTGDVQGGHFATQYFGFNALPGGGLYLLKDYKTRPRVINVLERSVVQNGRLKGRKLDHGAFVSPDLSYDGRTIVFAWTENSQHQWIWSRRTMWHVFKVNVDGSNLVQLTDGAYDDFDPCWLPDGRIAFISERRGGHIRCFSSYLKVRNYTMFSMKDDGSDMLPLSYFETSEWNPSVNNDGRLVYMRWDYTDRENCLGTRFWVSGPDGTDPRSPHGNYPLPYHTFPDHKPYLKLPGGRETDSRVGSALVEMGIRAVPDSPLYICTGAPHHGEIFGSLCMLDLRGEDDRRMSQVKRITPDEPFPESETPGRRHYKYGTPWPLSEDFYLCNVWENMCLLDRYGNKELLCDLRLLPCVQDERLRIVDPIPVRPRFKPPVIPSRTAQGEKADPNGPKATLSVMNVYDSDLPLPKGTRIRWLRVVQNCLKSNHTIGEPMLGYEREATPRIPLGIVPVEEDGSAYFEAPVAKELIFQALDENYMAVQSMRAVAYVHPGERLVCQGCHEPTHKSPTVKQNPLAMRRAPSRIQPEIGPVEPMSYYRQVKPIFEAKCVGCHAAKGKGPKDMSHEGLREYTFWFSGAMWQDMCSPYSGIHGGSRTIPGRFGARYCRLGKALMDDTHKDVISPEDRHKIIVWIECNSLRLGAYTREVAQMRGELVWPELDVDPENVLGVEGRGRPLKHNFWHENMYGPHPFLGTSHAKRMIYLMDEQGRIVWDYAVPNPQDVWMLPNGNIVTTWLHGVREVTRDKQIVWEYKVEAPNEVPTLQPLPDGTFLIGIVGECRLIEVNRQGRILHEVRLSTTEKQPHAQFRMCRKTAEGTYLVPFTAEGAVREFNRDGVMLREFPRNPLPVCALRLEDGDTLISAGGAVTEYDKDDRIMWELTAKDIPDINLAIFAGIQRLPNGNTIVCNWNTKDEGGKEGAHILEVTPDKRIVWQVTGDTIGQVAQCQVLSAGFTPRTDGIAR
jgi:hypothetical protein